IPRGKKGACAPAQFCLPGQSFPGSSVAATVVPSWDGAAPERQHRYSTGAAAGARAGQGAHVAATETQRCVDGPSVPPAQGMQVGKWAGKPGRGQTWQPSFVKSRLDSHLPPSQFTKKRDSHVTLQFIVGTDHLDRPRKRACLTAMHNFFLTRSDGTTAAERFFGQKPRSMFAAILASIE